MTEQASMKDPTGGMIPEEQQKMKEQMAEQFKMENVMKSFLSVLSQKGWESLGMMANPYTGMTDESLDNAKLSIDTVDFIYKRISDRLEENEKNEIRANLTNLKMSYVSKVKAQRASESDTEEQEEEN
jgi:hypothetical protein